MTVAVENEKEFNYECSMVEEKMPLHRQEQEHENIHQVENQHLFNLSDFEDKCSIENNLEQLEKGIPFNMDERELDREIPYLRSFEAMDEELDSMNPDEL